MNKFFTLLCQLGCLCTIFILFNITPIAGQSLASIQKYLRKNLKYEKDSSEIYLDNLKKHCLVNCDSVILADYYFNLGQWHHYHGTKSQALDALQLARKIIDRQTENTHSDSIRCPIYYSLADQLSFSGRPHEAADMSIQAVQHCERVSASADRGNAYYGAAVNHLDIGDYTQALYFMNKTYELDLQLSDSSMVAADLHSMSKIATLMYDHPLAIHYNKRSLQYISKNKKYLKIARKKRLIRLRNIGSDYLQHGQLDSANIFFQLSLNLAEIIQDSLEWAQCYAMMAEYHLRLGDNKLAHIFASKAVQYVQDKNERILKSAQLILSATLEPKIALPLLNDIMSFATDLNDQQMLASASSLRAKIHEAMGNDAMALADLKLQMAIRNEKHNIINNQQLKKLKLNSEIIQNQQEIANLEWEKSKQEHKNELLITRSFSGLICGLALFIALFFYYHYRSKIKLANFNAHEHRKEKEHILQLNKLQSETFRAQMNPHFMFNSLNSINKYILTNESRIASKYLTKFSALMRLVLEHTKLQVVPIQDEIRAMTLYLQLEQMRLQNKFQFKWKNKLTHQDIMIPPMIFQPFLENAVWHGLSQVQNQLGQLEIKLYAVNKQVIVEIQDNGIGQKQAKIQKTKSAADSRISRGLQITKNRLELLEIDYQIPTSFDLIDLSNIKNSSGTLVVLKLPLILSLKNKNNESNNNR